VCRELLTAVAADGRALECSLRSRVCIARSSTHFVRPTERVLLKRKVVALRGFALASVVLAFAAGCERTSASRAKAARSVPCDSATASRIVLDTVARLDTIPRRILAWQQLRNGWSVSTYPDPKPRMSIMDGGIAVRLNASCSVVAVVVGDSV
jgi:hypothetical protein